MRRGKSNESDILLADFFIYDPILISLIRNGKRAVSCGYDCLYVLAGKKYEQRQIRGNHIAIVKRARAGKRIAIKE
ncbi:hypothetical protein SOV_51830 [Sporomusa ovata DSM 2662]|nr:hypothetical protein SOV_2c04520 [Sporomusa ovata DSM 2662]